MKFIPVLKWMINITLFVALAAGVVVMYVWKNSDDFVQEKILADFSKAAPDLELKIGHTVLHGTRGATLADIKVVERTSSKEIFRAKELRVTIDSTQLIEHQRAVIEKIHLKSADILLTRLENGRWNWQKYTFNTPNKKAAGLPHVILEDLRIQLTLKHGQNIPNATLSLRSPKIQAVPASQDAYDFDGGIALQGVGLLKLSGFCDLNSGEWKVGGDLHDVPAKQDLMALAIATNPQLQDKFDQLDVVINSAIPGQELSPPRQYNSGLLIGGDSQKAPRISGLLDLRFNAGSIPNSLIPAFQLLVTIRDGKLESPSVPLQLSNVTAKFYKDNNNLEFRLEKGEIGDATIKGDLLISSNKNAAPPTANFKVQQFPVTEKLRPLLDAKAKRIFDAFAPVGRISATGSFVQQPNGKWQPRNIIAQVSDATITYHKFRYPVNNLTGTVTQRPFKSQAAAGTEPATAENDVVLDVNLNGMLGETSAVATGWWRNPGPTADMRFEVIGNNFPLDGHFRNALEEKHQRVVESLALEGAANAKLVFYRPPGLDNPTQPYFDIRVANAKMRFVNFPYDINDLTGHLTYHGPTKHWRFHNLSGTHGSGQLRATGEFRGKFAPGDLDLTIVAKGAELDSDLYNALSRSHRNLWNMVNPDGLCDLTTNIHWTAVPGQPAIVSFPEKTPVRIYDTKIRPAPFPLDMQVREAVLSFDPNDPRNAGTRHCEIHSFDAIHGNAPLSAKGWIEGKPDGEWQVHLNQVNAKDLKPDEQLRAALPESWSETLNKVHKTGSLSIQNSEMDFRGDTSGQRNTTARWKLNLGFYDCAINAGLDVSHIFGQVTANGVWDGFHMQNNGAIGLETAEVLDMPFTSIRGPYSLNDVELILGTREVFEAATPRSQVNRDTRVKCQAYGGELLFDALVDMRDGGQYRLFTELANARLEHYAALHIPEQRSLKGVVSAWMDLQGTGDDASNLSGQGQLRISPAALYELPVMVKLLGSLSQLNFNTQNLTAFDYAILDFKVAREAFWLNPIHLVGEAISFVGEGSVGFSGAVDLDFYSRPARTRTVALPIISGLFTNWAKITVRGTTDRPQTHAAPLGQVDDGVKQFLKQFNPNPAGPVPGLAVPRFFQPSPLIIQRRTQNTLR